MLWTRHWDTEERLLPIRRPQPLFDLSSKRVSNEGVDSWELIANRFRFTGQSEASDTSTWRTFSNLPRVLHLSRPVRHGSGIKSDTTANPETR
jgi:hypothetical protein